MLPAILGFQNCFNFFPSHCNKTVRENAQKCLVKLDIPAFNLNTLLNMLLKMTVSYLF